MSRSCLGTSPAPSATTIGRSSRASYTCSPRAAAGATAQQRIGRARASISASTGGRIKASGGRCCRRWPRRDGPAMRPPSTVAMSGLTARPTAVKRSQGARHRPLARRADDQDPRRHRRARPPWRSRPDTRQCQRRDNRACRAGRGPRSAPPLGRRQELRRRLAARRSAQDRHHARHPGQGWPQAPHPLDKRRYCERWRIEATFNRPKDFRRIATRYDKLARNYASALALAAAIAFWC